MEINNSCPSDHIWCVIPAFTDRDSAMQAARVCRSRLEHVVVVDDGSADKGIPNLFSQSDIGVLEGNAKGGAGEAVLTALRHVERRGGRFMITIDADGRYSPSDIGNFIPLLQEEEAFILLGRRRLSPGHISPNRGWRGTIIDFCLRLETGMVMDDYQSSFRAYPVRHLSRLSWRGSHDDFNTEVLVRAIWAGLRIKTVSVDFRPSGLLHPLAGYPPRRDTMRIFWLHARLIGRRLLPIPHRRLVKSPPKRTDLSILRHPLRLIKILLNENATPGGLAVAAAAGVFLATLPLVSIHTVVIIYVATRLHLNKVMAVVVQNLCLPPFIPVACIELGHYLRYGRWLTDVSPDVVVGQLLSRLWEWLLGALIIAPLLAVAVGAGVFFISGALQNQAGWKTASRNLSE